MRDDLHPVREAVLASLKKAPVVRPWPVDAARVLLLNLGVSAFFVAGWALSQPAALAPRWVSAGLLLALVACGSVAAVRPGGSRAQLGVLGLAAAAAAGLLLTATGRGADLPWLADADCALAEIGVALVPALATALALRRFSYRPLRALIGGLAAGATGVLVLDLTCEIDAVSHVLAFHLAPCAVVALVFVAVRSKLRSQTFAP
ncbi:MAG: NrsF family protein [Polyangiaceae bacterium]|jgi:hypothetical protein|nr:NrsF family protein [Polyangiaceae bacterium]